jgi:hypothetical protein
VKYKPVDCLKENPLKKLHLHGLETLYRWMVDGETGEAVMKDERGN